MADYCNCGAKLPEDALFCHKCGRAQRDFPEPEPLEAPPVQFVAPPAPVVEAPVNFHNAVAVRIALLVAMFATVLSFLPFLNWIMAGFVAVFFYCRRTGRLLNVRGGVRMGWITGILMFALSAVLFTIRVVPAAMSGRLAQMFQEQLKNMPAQDPVVQQAMQLLQSGPYLAAILLFMLGGLFVFITGFSMAGGALGAKVMSRG